MEIAIIVLICVVCIVIGRQLAGKNERTIYDANKETSNYELGLLYNAYEGWEGIEAAKLSEVSHRVDIQKDLEPKEGYYIIFD